MTEDRHQRVARAKRSAKIANYVLAVALAVMLGYILLNGQAQLQQLGKVAKDTKTNSDRLVDCTTPGGKCFEQGRSSTSGAIGTINKVTISAIYCSGKLGPAATVAALNACVVALIK